MAVDHVSEIQELRLLFNNYIIFASVYKNNSYSKYSWGLTPGPAILLLINKDI